MNLTLKELVTIFAPRHSRDAKPSVTNILIQNLLLLNDIEKAKAYLEEVFKHELQEVMDVSKGMDYWVSILKLQLKHSIKRLEGLSKPLIYRRYLATLSNIDIKEYEKFINNKSMGEEFLFISEVALKLKRSEKMVRNYIANGKLQARKDKANKTIIFKSSVDDFLKGID